MTIKQLQYVVQIVEHNSVTLAAKEFSVSQPAITKAVNLLEDEYGIRIFDRRAHGVRLTDEGREFLHYARGVLSAIEALNAFTEENGTDKKRLSVGTQQLDFIYELYDSCYRQCSNENMYFDLVETDRNDVVRQVLDEHVDVGFVVRTQEDEKDVLWMQEGKRLERHVVDKGSCWIAVGPGCQLYDRKSVCMEEVVKLPQIAVDLENRAKEAFWTNQRRYEFFGARHMIFCNSAKACEHFLKTTDAVAFVSSWSKKCFTDESIRVIPVEDTDDVQELMWVKLISKPLSPMETSFIRQVYEKLNKPVPEYLTAEYVEEQSNN